MDGEVVVAQVTRVMCRLDGLKRFQSIVIGGEAWSERD